MRWYIHASFHHFRVLSHDHLCATFLQSLTESEGKAGIGELTVTEICLGKPQVLSQLTSAPKVNVGSEEAAAIFFRAQDPNL